MKQNYRFHVVIILCILLLMIANTGCKKFVQIPEGKNLLPESSVFADSAGANSAVAGIYSSIMSSSSVLNFLHGGITIWTGLSADELTQTVANSSERPFYINSLNPSTGKLDALWTNPYGFIYQTNACIEGITASNGISTIFKNQLIGEVKFIRALVYFYLTNLFGDLPLVTITDYRTNAILPRASANDIYQQIISDLKDAQQKLTMYSGAGVVRPSSLSATALLARVYLYQQQWALAEAAATQVINSGAYNLESNLNNVFLIGSHEAILQLVPSFPGIETAEGNQFVPISSTTVPKYGINSSLLNSFESGDSRKTNWVKTVVVRGVTYNYAFKYQYNRPIGTTLRTYYMILRLAEQYLIRAEARAQLNTNLSGAISDLNIIRSRAGLSPTTAVTQSDVLTAIYHERQIELFVEMGHRWLDLKRTGQVNTVMSVVTPTKGGTWNSNYQLFPIPLAQIQLNPFLTQNPGY